MKMMVFALVALVCFNIGASEEGQVRESLNSEQRQSTFDLLMYLRQLENAKEAGMDQQDQSILKPLTSSDSDHPFMKLGGSMKSSTVPHSRVKRHRHSLRHGSWGCTLTTCQTHNLANWLYQMAANKGKDGTAPKNTADPHSYGKRRRRRSIFLPGYPSGVAQ
ncbi:pro-adrenomedullin-like [Hypanus sabinus]|uniref:pro-adrenomedullin-like n=1 Tax=Hypanus sabinus TaxID=79690 RepID=UPI0028C4258C|nr:pro-adrenomedullin-like [Hypanus sabinus]